MLPTQINSIALKTTTSLPQNSYFVGGFSESDGSSDFHHSLIHHTNLQPHLGWFSTTTLLGTMPSSQAATTLIVSSLAVVSAIAVYSAYDYRRKRDELRSELKNAKREIEDLLLKQEGSTTKKTKTTPNKQSTKRRAPTRTTIGDELDSQDGSLSVNSIGTVRSVYRLCVGTPRQGLLAPTSRGRIDLTNLGDSSAADSVIGLEGYSHIWVLFVFHLNTTTSRLQRNSNKKATKSKVSPPALGGEKVGILATRTPHRFNPIGITLCKLDRIERLSGQQAATGAKLYVSGLDLVDGTPVLDVKPYVPIYDSVGLDVDNTSSVANVPSWVQGGLATRRQVTVSNSAKEELRALLEKNPNALEFYGPKQGEPSVEDTLATALDCIRQVLAIDVRSGFQTKKARKGTSQAQKAQRLNKRQITKDGENGTSSSIIEGTSTQQLDNLLIHFSVLEAGDRKRLSSENSGAEDVVTVQSIQLFASEEQTKNSQSSNAQSRGISTAGDGSRPASMEKKVSSGAQISPPEDL